MKQLSSFAQYPIVFLRFALAAVLIYFGQDAVRNSEMHMYTWLSEWTLSLPVIGTPQFIFVLGVTQLLVASLLLFGVYLRPAALIAAGLLVGIIVNLALLGDFGAVFRNIGLLAGALVLATQKEFWLALKPEL